MSERTNFSVREFEEEGMRIEEQRQKQREQQRQALGTAKPSRKSRKTAAAA
jgi:hypothetical protein